MKRIMFLAFIGVTVFFHAANANQGIKDNEVVLCQAAPYSGLLAAANSESISGALAYFEYVNKKGGVSGRKIRLETRDDKQDPKLTLELTQQLVDKGCFALFMYRTSPSLQAILPLVNSQSIPLVAPQVGPQFLYDDTNKTIFNIRASYREEVTRAIEQLVSTGISRIALVHATDAFGQEGVAGVDEARKKFKFDIVGKQALDNRSPEVQAAVDMIVSTAPQASLIVMGNKPTAEIVKRVKAKGVYSQFITLSNNSSQAFVDELGKDGHGVMVVQVIPHPQSAWIGLTKEYIKLQKESPNLKISYGSYLGFISAKFFVEGLKRSGKNLTRERFVDSLSAAREIDLGGLTISTAGNLGRTGTFIELTMIGRNGQFIR